ncbi:MAG TPA: lactate racemase domain-containing protein, partial [Spirochaetia bacterium]|nr:lactate racemase domain-containing protein [Spirochaetia bacterium]
MKIELPYDTDRISCEIDDRRLAGILVPPPQTATWPGTSEEEIVRAALRAPIGSPPLAELARGKRKIVVITSDHTRAVPSALTL